MTPLLRSNDTEKQIKHSESMADIFNWSKELGVGIYLSFVPELECYEVSVFKDGYCVTRHISEREFHLCRYSLYTVISNAVEELNDKTAESEESKNRGEESCP